MILDILTITKEVWGAPEVRNLMRSGYRNTFPASEF